MFTINNMDFLAISSYYDSINKDHQSKSVIYEWRNNQFEPMHEINTNGATGVEYFVYGANYYLLFVNSRSSPVLYKWNSRTFVSSGSFPTHDTKHLKKLAFNDEGLS